MAAADRKARSQVQGSKNTLGQAADLHTRKEILLDLENGRDPAPPSPLLLPPAALQPDEHRSRSLRFPMLPQGSPDRSAMLDFGVQSRCYCE